MLPHLVVGCVLRYLGGEHCKSLVDVFGMSETSVQTSIDKFIEAVLQCQVMDLELPATRDKLQHQQTTSYQSLMPVISFVAALVV